MEVLCNCCELQPANDNQLLKFPKMAKTDVSFYIHLLYRQKYWGTPFNLWLCAVSVPQPQVYEVNHLTVWKNAVLKSSLIHSVVLYLVPPLQQNSFQEFFLSRYSTINCKCYYCVITTQTWSGRPHKVTEGGLETPTLRWFNKFKTSSGINNSSKTALGASSLHGFLWLSSSSNFAVILSLIQGNQTNSSNLGSTLLV